LLQLDDYDEALTSFEQALLIDGQNQQALCRRGVVLLRLKRYQDAIASFDQALNVHPHYAQALYYKGKALAALHQPDAALEHYKRALSIQSYSHKVWLSAGIALKRMHRYEDAIASLHKSLAIKPNDAAAFYALAQCFALQQKPNPALDYLQRAININSEQYLIAAAKEASFESLYNHPGFRSLIMTGFAADNANTPS
jgi:tetratricopeptide (TPR) repeat protein